MRIFDNAWAGILVALATACASHSSRPPATQDSAASTATKAPAPGATRDDGSQAQIAISDEIRKKCGLSDEDAYFPFDSARVGGRDRDVLQKVAKCFVSGPLAGKSMKLVGHADPRGEEEYNMALGGRRADHVKSVLLKDGMSRRRLSSTSRGAMDATGSNEAGWAKDRRVDLLLGT